MAVSPARTHASVASTQLGISRSVIQAALDQPDGPTEEQVRQICQLSYYDDSRKRIQKTIDRILKDPNSYAPYVVRNTFEVMKSCLVDASSEFVTFCIAQLQFIPIRNHAGTGNPAEQFISLFESRWSPRTERGQHAGSGSHNELQKSTDDPQQLTEHGEQGLPVLDHAGINDAVDQQSNRTGRTKDDSSTIYRDPDKFPGNMGSVAAPISIPSPTSSRKNRKAPSTFSPTPGPTSPVPSHAGIGNPVIQQSNEMRSIKGEPSPTLRDRDQSPRIMKAITPGSSKVSLPSPINSMKGRKSPSALSPMSPVLGHVEIENPGAQRSDGMGCIRDEPSSKLPGDPSPRIMQAMTGGSPKASLPSPASTMKSRKVPSTLYPTSSVPDHAGIGDLGAQRSNGTDWDNDRESPKLHDSDLSSRVTRWITSNKSRCSIYSPTSIKYGVPSPSRRSLVLGDAGIGNSGAQQSDGTRWMKDEAPPELPGHDQSPIIMQMMTVGSPKASLPSPARSMKGGKVPSTFGLTSPVMDHAGIVNPGVQLGDGIPSPEIRDHDQSPRITQAMTTGSPKASLPSPARSMKEGKVPSTPGPTSPVPGIVNPDVQLSGGVPSPKIRDRHRDQSPIITQAMAAGSPKASLPSPASSMKSRKVPSNLDATSPVLGIVNPGLQLSDGIQPPRIRDYDQSPRITQSMTAGSPKASLPSPASTMKSRKVPSILDATSPVLGTVNPGVQLSGGVPSPQIRDRDQSPIITQAMTAGSPKASLHSPARSTQSRKVLSNLESTSPVPGIVDPGVQLSDGVPSPKIRDRKQSPIITQAMTAGSPKASLPSPASTMKSRKVPSNLDATSPVMDHAGIVDPGIQLGDGLPSTQIRDRDQSPIITQAMTAGSPKASLPSPASTMKSRKVPSNLDLTSSVPDHAGIGDLGAQRSNGTDWDNDRESPKLHDSDLSSRVTRWMTSNRSGRSVYSPRSMINQEVRSTGPRSPVLGDAGIGNSGAQQSDGTRWMKDEAPPELPDRDQSPIIMQMMTVGSPKVSLPSPARSMKGGKVPSAFGLASPVMDHAGIVDPGVQLSDGIPSPEIRDRDQSPRITQAMTAGSPKASLPSPARSMKSRKVPSSLDSTSPVLGIVNPGVQLSDGVPSPQIRDRDQSPRITQAMTAGSPKASLHSPARSMKDRKAPSTPGPTSPVLSHAETGNPGVQHSNGLIKDEPTIRPHDPDQLSGNEWGVTAATASPLMGAPLASPATSMKGWKASSTSFPSPGPTTPFLDQGPVNPNEQQNNGIGSIRDGPSSETHDGDQLTGNGWGPTAAPASKAASLTSLTSHKKDRKSSSPSFPSPGPRSSKSSLTRRKQDPGVVRNSRRDTTPDSVLLLPKEEVAEMTFISGAGGLATILAEVDALAVKYGFPVRERTESLLKTLETVDYCLTYGSPLFVEHCHRNMFIFEALGRQYPPIRAVAASIVDFLSKKALPEGNSLPGAGPETASIPQAYQKNREQVRNNSDAFSGFVVVSGAKYDPSNAPPPPPLAPNSHSPRALSPQHAWLGIPNLKTVRAPNLKPLTLMKNFTKGASKLIASCIPRHLCLPSLNLPRIRYRNKHQGATLHGSNTWGDTSGNNWNEGDGSGSIVNESLNKPHEPGQPTEIARGVTAATGPTSMTAPLTPPASPGKGWNEPSSSLPISDTKSPKPSVTRQKDVLVLHNLRENKPPTSSVLLLQKEAVAEMTFISGKDGLETVLDAVNDLVKYGAPIRERPEDLLKALESVYHCIFHGSAPFVEHCRENLFIFSYLRRQSPLIRATATAIFDFFFDNTEAGKIKPSFGEVLKLASPEPTWTPAIRSWPTPKPTPSKTPAKLSINMEIDMEPMNESNDNAVVSFPRWGLGVPTASLFLLKKEDVAEMTFQREEGNMAATLMAVNDLMRSESPVRRQPDKLVQALNCILYCLTRGSAPFVERCREQRTIFNLLRQHSIPQVSECANAIFNFLKN